MSGFSLVVASGAILQLAAHGLFMAVASLVESTGSRARRLSSFDTWA